MTDTPPPLRQFVIRHGGLSFPALDAGSGMPLLLLHGGGSRAAHFAPLMRNLADRFRVIAYDQRGFGGMVLPEDCPIDHAHWASDVIGVLAALGLEKAILLGWSLGCTVAINAAVARPDLVAGLVLLGAPDPQRRVDTARLMERHERLLTLEEADRALMVREELASHLVPAARADPACLDALVADRLSSPMAMQKRTIAGYATRPDLNAAAAAVTCPAWLLTGAQDSLTPPDAAGRLAEALGAGEVQLLPGCGHYLAAENPALVAAAIKRVLAPLRA